MLSIPPCSCTNFKNTVSGLQIPFHIAHGSQKLNRAMLRFKAAVFVISLIKINQILIGSHMIPPPFLSPVLQMQTGSFAAFFQNCGCRMTIFRLPSELRYHVNTETDPKIFLSPRSSSTPSICEKAFAFSSLPSSL